MKKILFIIILLFIPFIINAETCETNKVTISNLNMVENTGNVVVRNGSIDNNQINLDLKFKYLNDNIKYKFTIKNDSKEDYEINNIVNSDSEYITYELSTDDNSKIVKSGTSKEAFLIVTYKNLVPDTAYTNDKYNESKTLIIDLSTGSSNNEVINPKTGYYSYTFILIMFIVGFSFIYLILNKSKYSKYFVLFILLIPICLKALCKVEVKVVSNIEIENTNIALLMAGSSTDSSTPFLRTDISKYLIEKITFTNGFDNHTADDYLCYDVSLNEDGKVLGWFTDSDNNGKYEMTIGANGKVYASSGENLFFALYNMTTMDGMEYFDTSYVTSMESMFDGDRSLTSLDVSHFDTSKVTNMSAMFRIESGGSGTYDNLTSLDLSNFDTSKVTDMSYMFANRGNVSTINVSSFNTSNVTNMSNMFYKCLALSSLDLLSFNTSKVTDMSSMFGWAESLTVLNLESFNTSNVTNMSNMFSTCINLKKIYVSDPVSSNNKFDVSNVTQADNMFSDCYALKGGCGTVWTSGPHNNGTMYAHIDKGSSNPGYFSNSNYACPNTSF